MRDFLTRSMCVRLLLIGSLAAGSLGADSAAASPQRAAERAAASDAMAVLEAAWAKADWSRVDALVADGFTQQREVFSAHFQKIVQGPDASMRVFGAAMLARHGEPAELGAIAKRLPASARDERRLLVRSIGTVASGVRSSEERRNAASEALAAFVSDQDLLVVSAAVLAYADLGRPEAVVKFADRITEIPATATSSQESDRSILNRAALAAFEHLAGERPKSVTDIRNWLKENGVNPVKRTGSPVGSPNPKTAAPGSDPKPDSGDEWVKEPGSKGSPKDGAGVGGAKGDDPEWLGRADTWNGRPFRAWHRFNIFYRIGTSQQPPASGDLAFDKLAPVLERVSDLAAEATAPVFGRVYAPTARLFVCDPAQFSARAKNAFFAGVTSENEIILKVDNVMSLAMTQWHEYIHWIHNGYYVNQPRWVAEGLAESFTKSVKRPSSVMIAKTNPQVRTIVARGALQEMVSWNAGGSSDAMEAARYAAAHLCIDFLRFGGFSVPDTRLAFLMGRVSRRENGRVAIEAVYGEDLKAMDERLRGWVESAKVPEAGGER